MALDETIFTKARKETGHEHERRSGSSQLSTATLRQITTTSWLTTTTTARANSKPIVVSNMVAEARIKVVDSSDGFIGFVVSLFGLIFPIYDHLPRIDIQPASELDDHDPSSTLFRITNTGSQTVRGINIICTLFDGVRTFTVTHGHVKNHGVSIFGGIEKMPLDEPITQQCPFSSNGAIIVPITNPLAVTMDFTVEYQFLWLTIPTTRHFTTRQSPDGKKFILVPDIGKK